MNLLRSHDADVLQKGNPEKSAATGGGGVEVTILQYTQTATRCT